MVSTIEGNSTIYLFMNKAGQQYHKGNTTNLLQHLEHNFNSWLYL